MHHCKFAHVHFSALNASSAISIRWAPTAGTAHVKLHIAKQLHLYGNTTNGYVQAKTCLALNGSVHDAALTGGMEHSPPSKPALPKVVIVTGPTGVGKTAVSLLLAERLGGEVVSADSVQVYRGLDVGSDKLSVAERRGVPHHLLDVCDVTEEYTAGRFHDEGRAAMRDIIARGRVPVVAGGTGFYLRLLAEGKPATQRATEEQAQAVDRELEQAWQRAAAAAGLAGIDALSVEARWEAGVALLGAAGDTEAMQRIGEERNNYFRLKRALAILSANPGRTMKELDVPTAAANSQQEFDFRTFFLYRPRAALHDKVDRRLQEMVLGGLLDEAAMLLRRGIAPGTNMASSAVGYRQAMTWLIKAAMEVEDSGCVSSTLPELVSLICAATHRLIRAQMTWFRGREEYKWLDMDALGSVEAAATAIMEDVAAPSHAGKPLPGQGLLDRTEQDHLTRRQVEADVLASRPADVASVMAHVTGELVPGLLSAPEVRPVLEAARQRQLEEQAAEAGRLEAAKQERLAKKAAAKEMHIARNLAEGHQGVSRKQQRRQEQETGKQTIQADADSSGNGKGSQSPVQW